MDDQRVGGELRAVQAVIPVHLQTIWQRDALRGRPTAARHPDDGHVAGSRINFRDSLLGSEVVIHPNIAARIEIKAVGIHPDIEGFVFAGFDVQPYHRSRFAVHHPKAAILRELQCPRLGVDLGVIVDVDLAVVSAGRVQPPDLIVEERRDPDPAIRPKHQVVGQRIPLRQVILGYQEPVQKIIGRRLRQGNGRSGRRREVLRKPGGVLRIVKVRRDHAVNIHCAHHRHGGQPRGLIPELSGAGYRGVRNAMAGSAVERELPAHRAVGKQRQPMAARQKGGAVNRRLHDDAGAVGMGIKPLRLHAIGPDFQLLGSQFRQREGTVRIGENGDSPAFRNRGHAGALHGFAVGTLDPAG